MKILLIDPPYGFEESGGRKKSFRGVLNKVSSLGLAYLAAMAEKAGHNVKIVDCTLGLNYKELVKIAEGFRPTIIGCTATTPTFRNALYIASILRKTLPEAIFVCGGAHPTASPADAMEAEVFDYLVLGEGEETLIELTSYLENKTSPSLEDIKGIAFKRDGRLIITPSRPRIDDLDSIPFPARDLLPSLNVYHPTPASYRKLPLAVIMTSRGCPSRCTFCDRAVFGEKFRRRSVSNVMAEVEEIIFKYGAREIRFFDDTFTLDTAFVEGICKGMKKLKLRVPWTCLTRVTAVNFDMLKMMHNSGCWQVLFGLESGDEAILRHLSKNNTVEQNRQAVLWAKKAGMNVRADFLVGSPWETKESFRKTVEFAKGLPLDFAHFNKFVPYPGTEIYRDLIAKGYKINFDRGAFINNHCDFVYVPEGLTKENYAKLLDTAYKQFYLRPSYIIYRLLSLRTFSEFIGHLKGFSSILFL
jgi:radical SAM superfamily enzyme YgiQ (UPF0313 family)